MALRDQLYLEGLIVEVVAEVIHHFFVLISALPSFAVAASKVDQF